jgi:hypothetical protein
MPNISFRIAICFPEISYFFSTGINDIAILLGRLTLFLSCQLLPKFNSAYYQYLAAQYRCLRHLAGPMMRRAADPPKLQMSMLPPAKPLPAVFYLRNPKVTHIFA